jgi:macrolide-specific efflux system membrane fusion protein
MRFPLILAAAGLAAAVFVVMTLPAASQPPGKAPPSGFPAGLSSSRRTDAVVPPPASPGRLPSELSPLGLSRSETQVSANAVVATGCLVTLMDDCGVDVPAQKEGKLKKILVRERQLVKEGEPLANVDDSEVTAAMELTKRQLLTAQAEADNDVNIRYAQAAFAVARAEWQQALEANAQQPNTFSKSEVLERQLKARQYELQIQQSEHERKVYGLKADEKKAELNAAQVEVDIRQIKSGLEGMVVERYRNKDEWVKPGDPVVRVVRVDQVRIEGMLDAKLVLPEEVEDQPVTITVELPNRKSASFPGTVVYASQLVEAGMQFLVHAQVENRKENGFWLLRPGLTVQMTIQRKKLGPADAHLSR